MNRSHLILAASAALAAGALEDPIGRKDDNKFEITVPKKAVVPAPPAPRVPRRYRLAKYAPCPCGSGKKKKFCCGKRGDK